MIVLTALLAGFFTASSAQGALMSATAATSAAVPGVAPIIPARIDCSTLVQNGGTRNLNVPNFEELREAPTRITSARVVAATSTQPEYCDVQGYVQPQIKFQLKLPTSTWQGRYLQVGCGGFCGFITPTTFPACRTDLGGDFAVGATNDGHDGSLVDTMWAGFDTEDRIDYAYRAVHVVSIAAKAIQKAYYGQAPRYSYLQGCSTGGREGLMEAQRYPDDFDGIVAGAPANLQTTNPLFMGWGVKVNTGADGKPILTNDKIPPLHDAVVKACDANDGVVGDGLIGDPRDCTFDPAAIQCTGADAPTCLTAAQVKVVRAFYEGVLDEKGRRLDPRIIPRGSELSWIGYWAPTPAPATAPAGTPDSYGARTWGDGPARWFSFAIGKGRPLDQVDISVSTLREMEPQARVNEALNPNLRPFRASGGKLMIYQGLSDYGVTPSQTFTYYDALRDYMGGQAATDKFARLYAIPGMGHCGGGPTPDASAMLLQMVRWVEAGQAPESILVTDRNTATNETRQRPVFRYPQVAKYIGPDPVANPTAADKPENFVAAAPTRTHVDHVDWEGNDWLKPRFQRG
jgi:feruloyl esterase